MNSIRHLKPRRKCGSNGPYNYAFKILAADLSLMKNLRAIALRLNHTLVQITEDICIEYFAPDLTQDADTKVYAGVFSENTPEDQGLERMSYSCGCVVFGTLEVYRLRS